MAIFTENILQKVRSSGVINAETKLIQNDSEFFTQKIKHLTTWQSEFMNLATCLSAVSNVSAIHPVPSCPLFLPSKVGDLPYVYLLHGDRYFDPLRFEKINLIHFKIYHFLRRIEQWVHDGARDCLCSCIRK